MKIGTYNVLGLTGYPAAEANKEIGAVASEANMAHFAGVFSDLQCDMIALQEGIGVRPMQQIAKKMGYYLATLPSPIAWPGHVLSRYPIAESRTFSHMVPSEDVPAFSRTAGAVLLEVGSGERLWVVDVHLHPGDVALRAREGDILGERLQELSLLCANIVVLGDFNSEVDEKVHENLRALNFTNAMEAVGGGIAATMDTVGIQTHYIDHLYFSSTLAPKLKSAHVVREAGFRHDGPQIEGLWVHSDHLPVVAELDWDI